MFTITNTRRTTVDVDTRRNVVMIAQARKPRDVAAVPHEQFIRNTLKDKMGWPRREPAPESIKVASREIAAFLKARDKAIADKKAAQDAAVVQGIADTAY